VRELYVFFTPTDEEGAWVGETADDELQLGITPDDYDVRLDVDFTVLGEDEAAAA
jgi:hypothetical protein